MFVSLEVNEIQREQGEALVCIAKRTALATALHEINGNWDPRPAPLRARRRQQVDTNRLRQCLCCAQRLCHPR
jgi:hypothetical protein